MAEVNKIPIVNEDTQKALIKTQAHVVNRYNYNNGSNRKDQGVLYRYYREPTYFFVNFMLREGRMPNKEEAEKREWMDEGEVMKTIVQLDEVFKKIEPIPAPIVVYRGVALAGIKNYTETVQFQSTSFIPENAYRALHGAGCCLFKVTLPAGTKAIFTGNQLKEVILDRNTKIAVTSMKPVGSAGGVHIYDAVAVNGKLLSMEQFIAFNREKAERGRGILEERKMALELGKSDADKVLDDLSDDMAMEDVDVDMYREKLKLSKSDFAALVKNVDPDDALDKLKENYSRIKGL